MLKYEQGTRETQEAECLAQLVVQTLEKMLFEQIWKDECGD